MIAYAGAGNGIRKTEDGGLTWKVREVGARVFAVAIDPVRPSTIYVGKSPTSG